MARRTVLLSIGVVVLGSTSIIAIGALTSPTTSLVRHEGATTFRWIVPHDQSSAPTVLIPGGAMQGNGNFNAVSCPTTTKCVAVGADEGLGGVASVSLNGGGSWTQASMDAGEPDLNAVDCVNSTTCVAVGQGAAVWSTDGGNSWTSVTIPTSDTTLLGVSCPTSTLCVTAGVSPGDTGPYEGQVLISSNSGKSWKAPTLPASAGAIGSVDCPTSSFCVAVGATILVSNDGGATWNERAVKGGTGVLRSVSCASATTCVAVGANPGGMQNGAAAAFEVSTSDGGATWTSDALPNGSSTIDVVSCAHDLSCTVSGPSFSGGTTPVYSSTNGGGTWASVKNLPSSITAVGGLSCRSLSDCVFIGQSGRNPVSITTSGDTVATLVGVTPMVRAQRVRES